MQEMTLQEIIRTAVPCPHLRRTHLTDAPLRCYNCADASHDDKLWHIVQRAEGQTLEAWQWQQSAGMIVVGKDTPEDVEYCRKKNALHPNGRRFVQDAPAFLLCAFCNDHRPKVMAVHKEMRRLAAERDQREREADDELIERFRDDEPLHHCTECDMVWGEDELVPVRYCSHCDQTFDATDGRNCTECNRPFTRRCVEQGCPDCLLEEDNGTMEKVESEEQLRKIIDGE